MARFGAACQVHNSGPDLVRVNLTHSRTVKLTREQLRSRKDKAVRFVEDVKGDPERAAEIEAESLEDYAERRKIELLNPKRRQRTMAKRTEIDLQEQELAEKDEELAGREEIIDSAHQLLDSVYTPEATRSQMAAAIGEALETLAGAEENGDDNGDDE